MASLFDGATFSPKHDHERLRSQLTRIRGLMGDGQWRTLDVIAACVGGSEAGVSARLRDLRKIRFGSYTVERRRSGDPSRGVFEYRVRPRWE